jgi:hypothetical protein
MMDRYKIRQIAILAITFFMSNSKAESLKPFEGLWKGSCSSNGVSFRMELDIQETTMDTYQWKMVYFSTHRPPIVRNYRMLKDTTRKDIYWLDEGFDARFIMRLNKNSLSGLLRNGTAMIHEVFTVEAKQMSFILHAYKAGLIDIQYEVGSFFPTTIQECLLGK